jgi:DNA repair exonuclease SbcCD ATPase subunit
LSNVSNLDLLEKKITNALEKITEMREENRLLKGQKADLEKRLREIDKSNSSLQKNVARLESKLQKSKGGTVDLEALKGRVDGILAKFEQLDL